MKKGSALKKDNLTKFATSLLSEVNNLQGNIQTLGQCSEIVVEKTWDIWKNIQPKNNAYHQHTSQSFELESCISRFEISMPTSKYLDTSHMSKLERDKSKCS